MAEEEKLMRFNQLNGEYENRFGRFYPLDFWETRPLDELVAAIEECLRTGVPAKEEPWDPNFKYIV